MRKRCCEAAPPGSAPSASRQRPHGLVLMYHRVAASRIDPWGLCVSPERFAAHVELLAQRADVVPLDRIHDELRTRDQGRPVVAVTFDDGYQDNLTRAAPTLRRCRVPATVFLATGFIGARDAYWWDELAEIVLTINSYPGVALQLEVGGKHFRWSLAPHMACAGATCCIGGSGRPRRSARARAPKRARRASRVARASLVELRAGPDVQTDVRGRSGRARRGRADQRRGTHAQPRAPVAARRCGQDRRHPYEPGCLRAADRNRAPFLRLSERRPRRGERAYRGIPRFCRRVHLASGPRVVDLEPPAQPRIAVGDWNVGQFERRVFGHWLNRPPRQRRRSTRAARPGCAMRWTSRSPTTGTPESTTRVSTAPWGTAAYFAAMDAYRREKTDYLPSVVDFDTWAGRDVLDLGCGAGLDLMRFHRGGARAVGVDLSGAAVRLASQYGTVSGLHPGLVQADGAHLPFRDATFDLVYCHGVLPFARDAAGVVAEARRVLRPSGVAIFMAYNRHSWAHALATVAGMPLGHGDAPVFRTYSQAEFAALLRPFGHCAIVSHRWPSASSRRRGLPGFAVNALLLPCLRHLPRRWTQRYGWHLIASCR